LVIKKGSLIKAKRKAVLTSEHSTSKGWAAFAVYFAFTIAGKYAILSFETCGYGDRMEK